MRRFDFILYATNNSVSMSEITIAMPPPTPLFWNRTFTCQGSFPGNPLLCHFSRHSKLFWSRHSQNLVGRPWDKILARTRLQWIHFVKSFFLSYVLLLKRFSLCQGKKFWQVLMVSSWNPFNCLFQIKIF